MIFVSHGFEFIVNVVEFIFDRECEVLETIASDSLYVLDPECVFVDEDIVRNIYWLGLWCDLKIINL